MTMIIHIYISLFGQYLAYIVINKGPLKLKNFQISIHNDTEDWILTAAVSINTCGPYHCFADDLKHFPVFFP